MWEETEGWNDNNRNCGRRTERRTDEIGPGGGGGGGRKEGLTKSGTMGKNGKTGGQKQKL